jgi:hypothetical protein
MKTRTHRSATAPSTRHDLDDLLQRDDRRVPVDVRFHRALQRVDLGELRRSSRPLLVATALEHGASDADAEDAVHDVLLQVLDGEIALSRNRRWAIEELKHLVIARCDA